MRGGALRVMTRGLLLWDHCHILLNGLDELTEDTESDTNTAGLTAFDLFIRENTHADVYVCCHGYQMQFSCLVDSFCLPKEAC